MTAAARAGLNSMSLHSTVVLLKVYGSFVVTRLILTLHSTVVLLKER